LDEIQAAILRVKLRHLEDSNEKRHCLAEKYTSLLQAIVTTPIERADCRHVFHLYVIQHPERDALQSYLAEHGIGTGIHYPIPIHLQPTYRTRLGIQGSLPISEKICRQILSLPLYPQMDLKQVEFIAEMISNFGRVNR
jgi:dTDP-4-amino-4,6-dideoxygalactose transaminase